MKKVLFLMFLLFLMVLGTVHVNAQVRIGGNAAPNGAAILDLNATDAATGTKGLALPRVRLDSASVQITPGVANLTGMLVYNTTATLGVGIYFWSGSTWVKASLPSTSAADSGKFLMSNGKLLVLASPALSRYGTIDTLRTMSTHTPVSFTIVLDTFYSLGGIVPSNAYFMLNAPGLVMGDFCYTKSITHGIFYAAGTNAIYGVSTNRQNLPSGWAYIRCYRPSA